MSIYMTEEEQIEAIKTWWRRHQRWITLGLTIVLLFTAGYRLWAWHTEKQQQQASMAYERLMSAFSEQDDRAIVAYAKQLSTEYPTTVYHDVAQLVMAQYDVSHQQLDAAEQALRCVVDKSKIPALKQLASLRIARILMSRQQYEQALQFINQLPQDEKNAIYLPVMTQLKAEITQAMGQRG